ncbi:MAG TPA: recombinase family protein [Candidatus Magasanikbacteria bacterium]|nr:recombinase family protein [Candidatus Magasanikbacteria bacterium]
MRNENQLSKPLVEYCLYARKSTEDDEKQALSIGSQISEMKQLAEREGLFIKEVRQESHSAKESNGRPVFKTLLEDIRLGKFTGIIAWAPDRLSRNAGDLGSVVDLMDQGVLKEIRTHGQRFTNNPNEKFLLMILGSQAKLENDNRSINIKRGMRARCEMGLWPGVAPVGYSNEKRIDKPCSVIVDPERMHTVRQIFEKVAYESWSGRKIHAWLIENNFRSRTGKYLTVSNLFTILKNTFYYGVFEYPTGSGSWYTGKYEPLITKELFDRAQQVLREHLTNATTKRNKEFAFTRMMTCGQCGSGITADEKFKYQQNGNVHRYVYYVCTRNKDQNCRGVSMNEKEIIKQLSEMIDNVSLDRLGIKQKLESEIDRYSQFRYAVLGLEEEELEKKKNVDMKKYAKYILENGALDEKRKLMQAIKNKLTIVDRKIALK